MSSPSSVPKEAPFQEEVPEKSVPETPIDIPEEDQVEFSLVPDVNLSDQKLDIQSDEESDHTPPTLPLKQKENQDQVEFSLVPDVNFSDQKLDIQSDEESDHTPPTLPLKQKENQEKAPHYIFPLTRLKSAWSTSSNLVDFVLQAVGIVFSTLGWLCCVGGVPLMSLVMLIIGCLYLDECRIQPKIPVYLVVAGVLGTLQHFISVWTKYIPKKRFRSYRVQCLAIDYTLHLFLTIWFVLGCIWVYGSYSEVDFKDSFKDEYCHKTLFLFAFWVLNLSFILLAILIVCTLVLVLFIVISPTDD